MCSYVADNTAVAEDDDAPGMTDLLELLRVGYQVRLRRMGNDITEDSSDELHGRIISGPSVFVQMQVDNL